MAENTSSWSFTIQLRIPVFIPRNYSNFTFCEKHIYGLAYRNNKPHGKASKKQAVEIVKV